MLVTTLLLIALSLDYCFATCLLFHRLSLAIALSLDYCFATCLLFHRLSLAIALLFVVCWLLFHYLLLAILPLVACCFIVYCLWLSHLLLPHFVACYFIVLLLSTSSLIASLLCWCLFQCLSVSFCCLLYLTFATLALVPITSLSLFFMYQLPTPLALCCYFVASFVAWVVVSASTHDFGVQVVEHGTFEPTNSIFLVGFLF